MYRALEFVRLFVSVLVIGGFATTVAAADAIHACVNKTSGVVRIVAASASCAKNEMPLSWNITGPKGDPGEPGTPGTNGDPGTPGEPGADGQGPAYRVVRFPQPGEDNNLTSTVPGDELIKLDLPAGSYAFSAAVLVSPLVGPPAPIDVICTLTAEGDGDGNFVESSSMELMPLSLLHTFAADGSVLLNCYDAETAGAMWWKAMLTAIQVKSTNTTIIQ